MKNYFRMLKEVRPHLKILGLAALGMLGNTLSKNANIMLLIPLFDRILKDQFIPIADRSNIPGFILNMIDAINAMPRLSIVYGIIFCVLIFTLVNVLSQFWQAYFMSDLSYRVTRDMRNKIYDHIIGLSQRFFNRSRSGELVSRITHDTGLIRDAIAEGLMDAMIQPMEIVTNLVLLLIIREFFGIPWSLVIVITVVIPLIVYPVLRIGKILKKTSRAAQAAMADINSSLYEAISNIRVVQAFGMENYERDRFHRVNHNYYQAMMRAAARNESVRLITDIVLLMLGCYVFLLGARLIISGGVSPGAFAAFAVALGQLNRPFKRLSRLHAINQMAMAASERIYTILNEQSEIQEPSKPIYLERVQNQIEYRKVSFGYNPDNTIIENIDLKVRVGEIIAVVGPSGSGKTTLLNLLPRFYDPTEGEVLIDGYPIQQVSIASLRNLIGIVTQDTILFNDTIAANIAYGLKEMDIRKIEEAARVANAHDFIAKLPQGYMTVVGDRGIKLSGGEKQRISIARAVLKDPPILILDEATSSLDAESERLVQDAIHHLVKGRTVLVIAHRLSTIRDANRIIVIKDKRIVEQGKHEDLIQKAGLYQHLYQMQFAI